MMHLLERAGLEPASETVAELSRLFTIEAFLLQL